MRRCRWLIFAVPVAVALPVACGDSYDDSVPVVEAGMPEAAPSPVPALSIAALPVEVTIAEGASAKISVDVTRVGGFGEAVQVALTGLPEKVSATPAIALLGASETHTEFTVTRERGAAPGDVTFSAHAAGGSVDANTLIRGHFPAISGGLDFAFGKDGIADTAQTAGAFTLGPDGRCVLVRKTTSGIEVLRYDSDAKLDLSWGSGGVASSPVTLDPQAIVLGKEGAVVVGGPTSSGLDIVRFGATGARDTAFGDAGAGEIAPAGAIPGGGKSVNRVFVRPNGSVLVLGFVPGATPEAVVAQLLATGATDPRFVPNVPVADVHVYWTDVSAADEAYILSTALVPVDGGGGYYASFLTRIDPTGDRGSFGIKTVANTLEFSNGARVRLAPDGSVLTIATENGRIVLRRFTHDGTPDLAFGTAGLASPIIGASSDLAFDAAFSPDGGILLVAQTNESGSFPVTLVRLRANGGVDTSFGDAGHVKLPIKGAFRAEVVVTPAGRIVVAANTPAGLSMARLFP